jgi:hypothetical protein
MSSKKHLAMKIYLEAKVFWEKEIEGFLFKASLRKK